MTNYDEWDTIKNRRHILKKIEMITGNDKEDRRDVKGQDKKREEVGAGK